MNNSKPSFSNEGSSKIEEKTKVCKSCGKIFNESRILKHITHGSCENDYTKEEIDSFRKLAYERTKRRKIELRHKFRKKRLESDILVLTEVCKSCHKTFSETSILKHLTHSECIRDYSDEEMNWLKSWADESIKDYKVDYWTENKETLALKRRQKIKKKIEIMEDILQTCKACNITFEDTSLLRHLSQKPSCKDAYGEKEWKYITGWTNERKKCTDSIFYRDNKDSSNFKEQKQLNNAEYWKKNKESISKKRKEKLEKDKISKQGLLKMCKSCKKNMGNKAILKHISQKESCRKDYNEDEMEYLRNLANKRNKAKKSKYYEGNKSSIITEKSMRYKEEKEKKKEEIRRKGIESDKRRFESSKKFKEKEARSHNSVDYSVAKNNFPQVFAEFKTFGLSEEDFQLVSSMENSIEETYNKFENEINKFADQAKELKYEDLWWSILEDMYCPIEPSLIVKEWHELEFEINLSLKDIATKMKKPYVWTGGCKCEKCQNAKNVKGKGKGKGKRSKN